MKIQVYRSNGRSGKPEWRWRLRAGNNRIIATGAEGYVKRSQCIRMAKRVLLAAKRPYITWEVEK